MHAQAVVLVGRILKIWLNRFVYGMYPNDEQWRINLSFISLALLGSVGYFATEKFKNI